MGDRRCLPSFNCSFFFKSSLASWVSFVLLRLISSLRFLSILSWSDVPARFSANFCRSLQFAWSNGSFLVRITQKKIEPYSSNLAFFSSSVKGAISSVDSAKSACPVLLAWNSAWATLRSFRPHSLHNSDFASSPGCSAAASVFGSVSAALSASLARMSSRDFSWFFSSQSMAPWTLMSLALLPCEKYSIAYGSRTYSEQAPLEAARSPLRAGSPCHS